MPWETILSTHCSWSLWNVNLLSDFCSSEGYLMNLAWDSQLLLSMQLFHACNSKLMSWLHSHEKGKFCIWTIYIKRWWEKEQERDLCLLESVQGLGSFPLSKAITWSKKSTFWVCFLRCYWVPSCITTVWSKSSFPSFVIIHWETKRKLLNFTIFEFLIYKMR